MYMENETAIILTKRESLRLLELLENPQPRNKKFNEAMARYKEIKNKCQSDDVEKK